MRQKQTLSCLTIKEMIFLLVFSLFAFTGVVMVEGHESTMMDKVHFNGGLTYNTFAAKLLEDGEEGESIFPDEMKNGFGFFVGEIYPMNENFGIEFGYDYAAANAADEVENFESDNKLSGFYGGVNFTLNENIKLKGLLTSYNLNTELKEIGETEPEYKFNSGGIGAILGGEYQYPMQENMNLLVNLAYRYALMDITNINAEDVSSENYQIDLSGLRLGVGVNIGF